MKLARVCGRVFCTRQETAVEGKKLLLIQPMDWDSGADEGKPIVAADCVGAGSGEKVFFVASREAIVAFQNCYETGCRASLPPIDAAIVGIVDGFQVNGL
ncbi:MAG TPA: EutN/CcmL family microcompartment protein [Elusimicrobiales bacterium]|nr:EutN/CcmL family microcompartment protein [Elusimicrobiales bacterium]